MKMFLWQIMKRMISSNFEDKNTNAGIDFIRMDKDTHS